MSLTVYLEGRKVPVDPRQLLGAGGEAEVFALDPGTALKLFKGPDHPDLKASPHEQEAARRRLEEHQTKLRAFPAGLPRHVVTPRTLATSRGGKQVLGYAMDRVPDPEPMLRWSDPSFRRAGASTAQALELLRHLHGTLRALHQRDVVVGDLNDCNLLVSGGEPYLIDADSYQFAGFPGRVFTERFVDPRLCDPAATSPVLAKPYDFLADWYAFAVLLLRTLLCVGPYGGVYRPADKSRRVLQGERPLRGLSVYHPEVLYPKPAFPLASLPDPLNHHLQQVFEAQARGAFPAQLLEDLEFQSCPKCKLQHARLLCPSCSPQGPVVATPQVRMRGACAATVLFRTPGVILAAALDQGVLRVVHHLDGAYRREDGSVLFESPLDPRLGFGLQGRTVVAARGRELVLLKTGEEPGRLACDLDGERPAFATNRDHRYWVHQGQLLRDQPGLRERAQLGAVLADRTRLWAGPRFGLGLYRLGRAWVGFVFDAQRPGLDDSLELPLLPGEVVDATCTLDEGHAWLFLACRHKGRLHHLVHVYDRGGRRLASHQAVAEDGSWAGHLGGKLAAGGMLLSASDHGLERVEVLGGQGLAVTRSFPESDAFVDSASRLLAGPLGLYLVGEDRVTALTLGPSTPRGEAP